jgi:zinc/manganese transport system substrate-binding protein
MTHDAGHKASHHGDDEHDPHAFQSPANAIIYVGNIAKAFCDADEAGCETYKANAAAYIQTLRDLDVAMKAQSAAIPPERRTVISSHDAFAYFGQTYGIEFHAAEGIATDAAPSAAEIAGFIDQAREDKASAIFVENISNPKLVEQIARETGICSLAARSIPTR